MTGGLEPFNKTKKLFLTQARNFRSSVSSFNSADKKDDRLRRSKDDSDDQKLIYKRLKRRKPSPKLFFFILSLLTQLPMLILQERRNPL